MASGSTTVGSSEMSTAITSGPLIPGPNPSATRSYARRWVCVSGWVPSSGKPRLSDSTGAVNASRSAVTPIAYAHAWLATCRPHRVHPAPTSADRCRRWMPSRSIHGPTTPRNAGSSVTEATTMMSTITEIATPAAVMNGTPATASPRIAMTTVPPAKITACPAVATARPAASATSDPRCRNSRCRVTRNSA